MSDAFAHCVKLARSLALTSTLLLPACVGAEDPAPDPAPPSPASHEAESESSVAPRPVEIVADGDGRGVSTHQAAPVEGEGARVMLPEPAAGEEGAGDDGDEGAPDAGTSGAGHLSGPLPPPELPGGFGLA
jgi:hypothetical protein